MRMKTSQLAEADKCSGPVVKVEGRAVLVSSRGRRRRRATDLGLWAGRRGEEGRGRQGSVSPGRGGRRWCAAQGQLSSRSAPATGTTQAGAADSSLVQRREGSGACRLVPIKHQHFFLCFKPEKQPHTAFHPHPWQQIFPYGRAAPPLFPLDRPSLCPGCLS